MFFYSFKWVRSRKIACLDFLLLGAVLCVYLIFEIFSNSVFVLKSEKNNETIIAFWVEIKKMCENLWECESNSDFDNRFVFEIS